MPHTQSNYVVITATTTTISSYEKYGRIWRRYSSVGIFIHRTKAPRDHQVPFSSPYVPLPVSSDQLPRTCSTRSWYSIEIHSDHEIEVDEQLQKSVIQIIKERDLDLLKRFGGVQKVASVLGSDLETGINEDQGLQSLISNPVCANGFNSNVLQVCNSSTIFLLLISAGLSFAIEIMEQGAQYGWHDGVAILVAVFVLVSFRSIANFHHQRQLEKQQLEKKNKLEVKVVRNGRDKLIAVANLVEGDLVRLEKGDRVPADGLYVNGDTLVLDEVLNSKIDYHESPFLSSGSKVVEGHGHMLVILVDANKASDDPNKRTFLETQIEKPNSYADKLVLSISLLIAFIVLMGLVFKRQRRNDDILPELKGNTKIDVLIEIFESMFWRPRGRICVLTGVLTAIAIGMQHGMSFAITASLSYWNGKLELSGVKPQTLSACGTMGLVTVICIDASGGLICNQMEVNEFFIGEENMNDDEVCETSPVVLEALGQGIGASTLVTGGSVRPIDDLLAAWAKSRWGANMELSDQCFSVLDHGILESNKNCSRVVIKKNGDDEGILHLHLKGDASTILNFCSHYYNTKWEVHAIKDQRRDFEQVIENMESRGLTAIAYACKQMETTKSRAEHLHLLALVGLKCSFQEIVEALTNAGVSIKLVSQDELSAVRDIAHLLGINPPPSDGIELEGAQIRDLADTGRIGKIEEASVMGSCLSEDKLLIVNSLKQNGHVVAFVGGLSTNDAPALKEADLAITKENQSTEMARKCSDIVLSNECSLRSLPEVLKYGRCAYNNIQNFTQLQLTACISGLLINLVAAICLWDSPLPAIQLIWMNFILCVLGYPMMVMELRSQELIANPPANRAEPLLTKAIWKTIATQALSQFALLTTLHLVGQVIPSINEHTWKSLVFNSFMLCQVFNQFKAMGIRSKEVAEAVLHHYWFLLALGTVTVMQVLITEFGTSLTRFKRLNLVQWVTSFSIALLSWGLGNAVELISVLFSKWFSRSCGSNHAGSSSRRRRRPLSFVVSLLGSPFSIYFLFSLPYYFYPDNSQAFRR
ncbi:calcium-transporting ATPase 12, plasma membrane-type [Ricinus communis]|uniref:Cation-transporting atpase plant, putative n=1 Tax=Ricinus communis TaxID=3988 RepID=B9T0C0_RICCO|nr:calcium-transporting ATPase 12, plasma membrane-type [Ricinus communis]EEF30680.1 cation-transporting atpase plant, putative [Ricinus communis]|eukprot:XP_025015317.1 calcium-transporting ATPase 12, plasma membrane-type [Ricinus communis]